MTTILKHRRGTTAQHASFTGAVGEITVDTDKDTAVVHDGTTVGGFPLLAKTMTDGTANGVAYLNGSKVLTTGSALTFDGTNLGVGTASAASKLMIGGSGANRISFSAPAGTQFVGYDGTTDIMQIASYNDIRFQVNAYNEAMRLTSTGLGIGNSSPTAKLDVTGTAAISGAVTLSGGTANGVAYLNGSKVLTTGSALTFDGTRLTSTTGKFGGGVASNSASLMVNNATNTATGIQLFQDGIESWIMGMPANSAGLAWSASGSEQMRLTSTGLGIGTSSPTYKFNAEVSSATAYSPANTLSAAPVAWLYNNNGTAGVAATLRLDAGSSGGNGAATISAVHTGSGSSALTFGTRISNSDVAERARIDSSGNLGLGVTPSAWGTSVGFQAFQLPGGSVNSFSTTWLITAQNAFSNSSGFRTYVNAGFASEYIQTSGEHRWRTAPSGTAGNAISFTQSMTLDASGNLLLGGTSALGGPNRELSINTASAGQLAGLTFGVAGTKVGEVSSTSNYMLINAVANAPMLFYTNNTERARIDSSGNLLVGTTSNTNSAKVFALATSSGPAYACQGYSGDVNAPAALFGKFDNDSTTSQVLVRFTINNNSAGSGQINANGANSAAFGSFSDARLKENIADLSGQLNNVMALRPVEFDYIESEGGGHQVGFIAQEMQEVYPDAVGERSDGMLTVTGWSKTEARLVKAIQEQQAIIESLKARLDAANL